MQSTRHKLHNAELKRAAALLHGPLLSAALFPVLSAPRTHLVPPSQAQVAIIVGSADGAPLPKVPQLHSLTRRRHTPPQPGAIIVGSAGGTPLPEVLPFGLQRFTLGPLLAGARLAPRAPMPLPNAAVRWMFSEQVGDSAEGRRVFDTDG